MYECECARVCVCVVVERERMLGRSRTGRSKPQARTKQAQGQLHLQQPEMEARQAAGRAASPNNSPEGSFDQWRGAVRAADSSKINKWSPGGPCKSLQ